MVEYTIQLDLVFQSLADPTRRDMLERISRQSMSISQIAKDYDLTFAAVSKHLKVMEKAKLIAKRREGKKQMVTLAPTALKSADEYLEQYRQMWETRFNKLDTLLKEGK